MRISKIKLSGFKSFVDPTTLLLPENLTGIVGPNGCGKSNVIDALLWVMGESSAKHLRGESMTDVIFNGSNTRKPVGQAMVEIIFDNSDATIGGQYASYAEISIKRILNREGTSHYLLNGTRCRRRDITNLFLGTGLGARSYSVIGQGMITRVIEARPEELRGFLEEAAGISKYKERRRDTENRIRHSRDNISRINDIREELEKQINRLQRQAKAAERYQTLKHEERHLQAQLLALQIDALKGEGEVRERTTRERENSVEAVLTELRAVEKTIEQRREEQTALNDSFNEVQGRYYGIGAEISRQEQSIQHIRDSHEGLQRDLAQARTNLGTAEEHARTDREALVVVEKELRQLEPRHQHLQAEEQQAMETLQAAEQAQRDWQPQWDEYNRAYSEASRSEFGEQTRISSLSSAIAQAEQQLTRLQQEISETRTEEMEQHRNILQQRLQEQQGGYVQLQERHNERQRQMRELRQQIHQHSQQLDETRTRQQTLKGRLSSLEALQQAALGQQQQVLQEWLRNHSLEQLPRLAQLLEVETGWEHAVELVLEQQLEALCVEDLAQVGSSLHDLEQGHLTVLAREAPTATLAMQAPATALADKLQCPWPVATWLQGIYAVEDWATARELLPHLKGHESIITRQGLRLGPGWLESGARSEERTGVLEREREIRELTVALEQNQHQLEQQSATLEDSRASLQALEMELDELGQQLHRAQELLRQTQAEQAAAETRLEQVRQRHEHIGSEQQKLQARLQADQGELCALQESLLKTGQSLAGLAQQREQLGQQREALEKTLENRRTALRELRVQTRQTAIRLESLKTRNISLQQALERNAALTEQLHQRRETLEQRSSEVLAPLQELESQLERSLSRRISIEAELRQAREAVHAQEALLRELDHQRSGLEQRIQLRRDELETARVAAQETRVRQQSHNEQLQETDYHLEGLLRELADEEDANIDLWQQRIETIANRIHRLGPINLAAISEFEQESERKEYLDRQHADLCEALETLEAAIRKIDRETRARFKETYDKVNNGLQKVFPCLFGGGHAQLELTGEDLLDTGVTVMAHPPGKRNSSIHLLSGGEKALTAVAFVFAIFQLNPAPFCLLDEVDAPLDDANVGRLCDMIREMSQDVQFMYITHNKLTMEISQQLIGVTMNEPGVSRLVSVNMEAAVELAATA